MEYPEEWLVRVAQAGRFDQLAAHAEEWHAPGGARTLARPPSMNGRGSLSGEAPGHVAPLHAVAAPGPPRRSLPGSLAPPAGLPPEVTPDMIPERPGTLTTTTTRTEASGERQPQGRGRQGLLVGACAGAGAATAGPWRSLPPGCLLGPQAARW